MLIILFLIIKIIQYICPYVNGARREIGSGTYRAVFDILRLNVSAAKNITGYLQTAEMSLRCQSAKFILNIKEKLMKKIILFVVISFSRLWKNEFRALVNKVVGVLDQFNPEALNLKFVYDKLVEAQAELSLLLVPEGKHPITTELSANRKNRKTLIRTLVSQIRILNSANAVYNIPQLEIVTPFVVRYLNPIVNVNSTVQTDVLDEMFGKLEVDTTLQAAITELNLNKLFDELEVLHKSIPTYETERSNTKIRQEVITSDVRINGEKALRNLMSEIELAQMKYPELDYNPLIEQLNDLFTFYMAQAKTRSTIRKQAAKSKVSTINTTTTAQNGNSDAVAS